MHVAAYSPCHTVPYSLSQMYTGDESLSVHKKLSILPAFLKFPWKTKCQRISKRILKRKVVLSGINTV